MLEHLHLHNVGPALKMELDLAPRLNLLTGDNGLGKSFLLDIAWWLLARTWPAEVNPRLTGGRMARPAGPGTASIGCSVHTASGQLVSGGSGTFRPSRQAWELGSGRAWSRGLVLYAQSDGGFAVWDQARNFRGNKGDASDLQRPAAYVFTPNEIWDGLRTDDGVPLCKGLIDDWVLWQAQNGEVFQLICAVLRGLSHPDELIEPGKPRRISLSDVRDTPTLRMPYGHEVPIVHASAGIRRIVALAYLLVWSWQEHLRASELLGEPVTKHLTLLLDELEAHLHPRWQRVIVRALLEVVSLLSPTVKVQIIAATHSPLVMASVEPWFDAEQDAWFDLDLVRQNGHREVQLTERPFVRQGDASHWLTSQAFDLSEATSVEAEEAITAALALLARDDATQHEIEAVDQKLRNALGDTDRFWVRWSQFRRSTETPR